MVDLPKEQCTGCGACSNICAAGSIKMTADEEGFLYPLIDSESCVACNACSGVCPVLSKTDCKQKEHPVSAYAAWSLDDEVRYNSTSGGIFTELARRVIAKGGFVAGAGYDKRHLVRHCIIGAEKEIPLLRQSKYVQSETGTVFKEIKRLLNADKPVMFTGTPCQAAGLKCFLGKGYENLLLCDFICRGVNSPKAYLRYLQSLERQYGSKIKIVWFKNKLYGWNKFGTKIEFENGKEYYTDRYTDSFMKGYLKYNLFIRPSCSNCKFKGFPRISDITLADFWGVSIKNKTEDTDKGTSLVILSSQKGNTYFELIADSIFKEETPLESAIAKNPCANSSIIHGEKRGSFFEKIDEMDFGELIENLINQEQKREE